MNDIYAILESIDAGSVLATIVQVDGSAYKKEGAAMLFKADGTQVGMLSAGCLEEDLAERIRTGLEKEAVEIVYDMRKEDDVSWGEGSGCNGVIKILVEKINSEYCAHLLALKEIIQQGLSVLLVKKMTTAGLDYLFIPAGGKEFGKWTGPLPKLPDKVLFLKSGMYFKPEISCEVYLQHVQPKPRFIIFGAGSDTGPLVSFASAAGFAVTISDWRPALCTKEHFPLADKVVLGFPSETLQRINIHPNDYVMIATHNFKRDRELLLNLKQKKPRYLGVLGSSRRTARLLNEEKVPPGITSPAGLSISACGPVEIAISIVAELIQIRHANNRQKDLCL